jgi:8-oxo-dGTP pyrophosphatase MutT (NUDIX family)
VANEQQAENDLRSFESRLLKALALELPYIERSKGLFSEDKKNLSTAASVLLLFGFQNAKSEPSLLITRRTETLEKHKGQMAFPGGAADAGEGEAQTALRETEEEVGVSPEKIRVLGALPGVWTPSGFWIAPVVGVLIPSIDDTLLSCSSAEIAEAFWLPLSVLRAPKTYRLEMIERERIRYATHVYQVGSHRIWGVTGAMIKNLLDRLAAFS